MSNIIEKLNILGLTKSESQIYMAILELGKTNVSAIATATKINRRNIYDSLSTLLDKGLIFQIVGENKGTYAGVSPDKLIELIQSREIALEKIIPDLEKRYQSQKVTEKAVIYKGVEGYKNYLEDILEVGEDVYCLGAKGGWGYKGLGDFSDWFNKERTRKKIKVYDLFDYEMKELITKGKRPLYSMYGEDRYMSADFSTNSAVDIFGDYVVTFTSLYPERFDDDVTLFVIQSKDLADSWRTWFKFLWDNSKG